MNSRPLIGKNSSPHVASLFIAVLVTSTFWICFTICAFVLKPFQKKQVFETVQIVLSSTPVETKTEEFKSESSELAKVEESVPPVEEMIQNTTVEEPAPADLPLPVEEPAAVTPPAPVPEKPIPQKIQETQKPVQNNTKTSAKSNETPADKKIDWDNFEYAADYSEGFDFSNKTSSTEDFDWDSFDKVAASSSQTTNEPRKVYGESGIEGSAAQITPNTNQRQSGGGKNEDTTHSVASENTKNLLNDVQQKSYKSSSGDGVEEKITVTTDNKVDNNGDDNWKMIDGSIRKLLFPSEPKIDLSREAVASMSEINTPVSKVTITFSVTDSGTVYDIKITPEWNLTEIVCMEIRSQLRNWKFQSSSSSASASFEYTITKK